MGYTAYLLIQLLFKTTLNIIIRKFLIFNISNSIYCCEKQTIQALLDQNDVNGNVE